MTASNEQDHEERRDFREAVLTLVNMAHRENPDLRLTLEGGRWNYSHFVRIPMTERALNDDGEEVDVAAALIDLDWASNHIGDMMIDDENPDDLRNVARLRRLVQRVRDDPDPEAIVAAVNVVEGESGWRLVSSDGDWHFMNIYDRRVLPDDATPEGLSWLLAAVRRKEETTAGRLIIQGDHLTLDRSAAAVTATEAANEADAT